jgi:hypothetical protein
MSTRFFTNQGDQTLLRKFQGVFESNADIEWFDALVGYLRASGYFAIRPFLSNVPHIRILVGINVDAIMSDYHRRGLLFMPDPTTSSAISENTLIDAQTAPRFTSSSLNRFSSSWPPKAAKPTSPVTTCRFSTAACSRTNTAPSSAAKPPGGAIP